MSTKRQREKTEKATVEEEASKNRGQTPKEKLPTQTFDEYQCSGNVEVDFLCLCALLDIKDVPAVSTKKPASSSTTETGEADIGDSQSQINSSSLWPKPYLQVDLENDDPLTLKNLGVSGWKVDEQIARVLQKMLPSLGNLQSLQFWQAGLTDRTLISLVNTISLCSNLRTVTLEGNPLPGRSYHLLLSEDNVLTHLSLRNNQIGAEDAALIGAALSTTRSANKNLVSLNLAFNCIGDAGAMIIAQGLRFNCALVFLSLSNNQIGDTGAAHLAAILGEFALTHEEVVERRKLLLERSQSEALKKDEKASAAKETPKSNRKTTEVKVPPRKAGKIGGKEKQLSAQEDKSTAVLNEVESVEIVNPLLDNLVQYRDGELILPGNKTLASLNLAGNRITEKSLSLFLKSLEMQGEEGGLLRLCLKRNRFPPDCECYLKIEELMSRRDPLKKSSSQQTEEEAKEA